MLLLLLLLQGGSEADEGFSEREAAASGGIR